MDNHCWECEHYFTETFCGYEASGCELHGSLDCDVPPEQRVGVRGATCPDYEGRATIDLERLAQICQILLKYKEQIGHYTLWAVDDVLGFNIEPEIISEEDLKWLGELGVLYNEEDGLFMFV